MTQEGVTQEGPVLVIANEFTAVWVRKIKTLNGERLEIHSPEGQTTIRVDPLQLEALSALSSESISKLLEN